MIRKWEITNDQSKKQCTDEILTRLDEQDGVEFGVIAAQEIIDIVAEHLGPQVYNNALDDAKKSIRAKLADLEIDLDVMKVRN